MATHHPPNRRRPESAPERSARGQRGEQLFARLAIGLTLLLLVARPLFPSEDADTGTGLIIVALWGLAAFLWAIVQVQKNQLSLWASWIDLGPLVMLLALVVAAIRSDTPRPAVNMACEWSGLVLSYLLARQLFQSGDARRAVLVAMVATAFTLAVYGIYQAFWGLDTLRAEYARDRMAVLQQLDIPPDTAHEETFRNRLNSHEPFATFALANSLAGFLVAWLPLAVGWCVAPWLAGGSSPGRPVAKFRDVLPRLACGCIIVLTILITLILTQSRTAYVGVAVQATGFCVVYGPTIWARLRDQISLKVVSVVGFSCLALIAGIILLAWKRGKIDEMVLTQATKSFSYRLEWWQATSRLIQDRMWTGTGPGNFRGHYLKYKLAQSSEEIADPHNLVFELAATGGAVAAAALIATLIAGIGITFRRSGSVQLPSSSTGTVDVWLSGTAAFALVSCISPLDPTTYLVLGAVWLAAAFAMFRCDQSNLELDPRVYGLALLGLVIHLLGAGGIAMPSVSQSLWLLLAIGLNRAGSQAVPIAGRGLARTVAAAALAGWIWFVVGVLQPVSASVSAVEQGRRLLANRDWGAAEVQFRRAAERDPLSVEPWIELSRIHFERGRAERGRAAEQQYGEAIADLERAHQLGPSRLEPIRLLAGLYESRGEQGFPAWGKAAEWYGQCVAMYPTSAALQARLSRALASSGQLSAAHEAAQRALQLDAETPHRDRKLNDAERNLVEPLQAPIAPLE